MDPDAISRAYRPRGLPRARGDGPRACRASSRPPCLPRARGDGPIEVGHRRIRQASPPRTRGWTPRHKSRIQSPAVSPAHAGMDLFPVGVASTETGLPRARGDGPSTLSAAGSLMRSPPRTRGWTSHFPAAGKAARVSPAHAGMDLVFLKRNLMGICLPRARGDGPPDTHPVDGVSMSPPRTRGWTWRA